MVNIWVLNGFIQQQLAFLHGPVLSYVEVLDVEKAGDVARHPDVVNPEELDRGGSPGQGGRGPGVGDEEPAGTVSGVELSALSQAGDFLSGNIPLTGGVSLTVKVQY